MPFDGIGRDPVIETLIGAKAIIQQYGWLQRQAGSYGGPRCVVGAMEQMAIEQARSGAIAFAHDALRPAVEAYSDAVGGIFSPGTNVMDWQDAPHRTPNEVLAKFDQAIERRQRTLAAMVSAN